jgi:hypothetical protein
MAKTISVKKGSRSQTFDWKFCWNKIWAYSYFNLILIPYQDKQLRCQHNANSAEDLAKWVGCVSDTGWEKLIGRQTICCVKQGAKADDGEYRGAWY